MFLAWNEIRYSKLRYSLIVGVMFLIAYLVFFLTGLAFGLAQDNRTAVDKWNADGIILSEESNANINMSMLPIKMENEVKGKEVAILGQTAGVIQRTDDEKKDEKVDVRFFGIHPDEFLMPEVTEGRAFTKDNEAIADSSLKEENNIQLNDTVKLAGSEETIKIVGFTSNAKFSVAPVLYTTVDTYQKLRFEKVDTTENARVNAIVVRGENHSLKKVSVSEDTLEIIPIKTFINELPGYNAQVLTFGFMIGFLIVIAAIVIGIFIYVLTMQKTMIFGVMKAQGISSRYIASSVIIQTALLAFLGVAIGLLGTVGTSLVLPVAVPFESNWLFYGTIATLILLVAILGAFFSVRTVVKVDPLKAIG